MRTGDGLLFGSRSILEHNPKMIENKKILISGFAGSIGSEIFRQLAPGNELFGVDIDETRMFDLVEELKLKGLNVRGRIGNIKAHSTVDDMIYEFKPDIIFHAAAYKHVAPNEQYPLEAINTNIIGTYNMLKYAKKYGVKKFINISTDKVINSNSVMGATKRVAELMVKNAGGISVRFGNVLGSRGSAIPTWQRQIDHNEPLTVTDERMERYFMSIPQAVELVIKASEIGEAGQILILDMGEPVNVLELAKEILKKSGKEDLGIRMIGMRPGETLGERLMTEDEEKRAIKKENFYVI